MEKKLRFALGVMILISCFAFINNVNGAVGSENQIISLDANFDGNRSLIVSFTCAKIDSNSYLTIFDINGTRLLSKALHSTSADCSTSLSQLVLEMNNLPKNKMVGVRLDINSPCALCSRSTFVYISPYSKQATVPDIPLIFTLCVVIVTAFILRNKK
ncbi:MAG: hypothetical protein WCI04_05970 [archaeon]